MHIQIIGERLIFIKCYYRIVVIDNPTKWVALDGGQGHGDMAQLAFDL